MSGNSVLDMAKAMKAKSQEKAQLIEKAALNAFHEQEQILGKALEESTTTISSAINDRSEDLIKALNGRNLELSNALNELIDTFNTNNATARRVLFKSWGVTLIGLVFLLLLGGGALWYQGQMIRENWDEIAQQNQLKRDLEPSNLQVTKDGKVNYIILPKGAKFQDNYTSDKGFTVVRWTK